MAQVNTKQVTTSTTAAQLVPLDSSRQSMRIRNEDATNIVRIGDSTVDKSGGVAANIGYAIPPLGEAVIQSGDGIVGIVAAMEFWIIADAGTPKVSVLEYRSQV